MKTHLCTAFAVVLTACGYTDAGGGSETLLVDATVTFDANRSETELSVTVQKNGQHVSGATVKLESDESGEVFTLIEDVTDKVYELDDISGYHRRMKLEVESGSDDLDAKLEGPGPHTITSPKNAETFKRPDKLEVKWKTDDGLSADAVTVRVGGFDSTFNEDDGNIDVEGSALRSGPDEVRVTRRTTVDLSGGKPPSKMVIEYKVKNDITVND